MTQLAHIVYYVHNLQASVRFYATVVGLEHKGNIFNDQAAILTGGGTHHELLLIQVGDAPGPSTGRRVGLYHAGWKVGESLDELRRVRDRIVANG